MALNFAIKRLYSSLDFRINPTGPATYDNHRGHNMEDTLTLLDGTTPLLSCRVQTVANTEGLLPGASFLNTIEAGEFFIKAFVPQRLFYGDIHGIVGAKTLKGELIDYDSITSTNPYRWLIHDTQKKREYPDGSKFKPGIEVQSAWSDGCFIMRMASLAALSAKLKAHGVKAGELLPAKLTIGDI